MRAVRLPAAIALAAVVAAAGVASAVAANAGTAVAPAHVYSTEVVNVAAPAAQDTYSPVKITGKLKAKTGAKWTDAGSVSVTIYYRLGPKASWGKIGTAKANSSGAFSWRHSVLTFGRKQWQVRIARQQIGTTLYRASTSGIKSTLFGARTSISGVSEQGHLAGGATLVSASINSDYVPLTVNAYDGPVRGTAKFYYLPKGKKAWIYEGSDGTNVGTVQFFYYNAKGHIRIVFPSQGVYLGSSVTAPIG